MAVYDDQKQNQEKDTDTLPSNDDLRGITGISESEEKEIEESAKKDLNNESGTSKDTVANKENMFASQNPLDNGTENAQGLYNPVTNAKFSFKNIRISKKQGGLIGAILAIGTALILGVTSLGPLQFIHFAQLLQAFHFSDQEYDSRSRIKKLIIYAKTKNVNNTRLGFIASNQATKIDKRLAANGWEIKSKGAVFDGLEYDPKKGTNSIKETHPDDIKKHNEKFIAALERDGMRGARLSSNGSKVIIDPDGLKYWSNRSLIRYIYSGNSTDVGRITAAFEKRILVVRAGLSWNPITKLDQTINKNLAKAKDELRKKISERVKGKVNPDVTVTGNDGKEGKTDEEKAKAKAETDVVAAQSEELAKETKAGKMTPAKLGGASAAGIGLICVIRTVAVESGKLSEVNRAIPLMQASALVLGTGSKVMSGDDVDMNALGEINKLMTSKEGGSFTNSSSLLYQQGKTGGTGLPTELDPAAGKNMVSELTDKIPGLDGLCNVLTNSIVSIGLSIATGGGLIASVALEALARTGPVQALFEKMISFFANDVIDITDPKYAGAIFAEAANVGTRINANETAAAMGGLPMSASDEIALNNIIKSDSTLNDRDRSIASKYLNPYQYDTPVAKVVDSVNSNDMSATITKIPRILLSSIFRPFSNTIHAEDARTPDQVYYGIKKVGFAPGELDSIEDPYANAEEARALLKSNSKYVELLKSCNKIIASGYNGDEKLDFTTETGTADAPATMGTYSGAPVECTENKDKNFLKIRVAAFDTITMKAFSCVEFDDSKSCTDISG